MVKVLIFNVNKLLATRSDVRGIADAKFSQGLINVVLVKARLTINWNSITFYFMWNNMPR